MTGGDEIVGLAHLRPSETLPGGLAEMGWTSVPGTTGAGWASRSPATTASPVGLKSVWALVHVANEASLRVAQRAGFLAVGTGIHYDAGHAVLVVLPTDQETPTADGAA